MALPLIMAAGMGGLGLLQGMQKQKADREAALANAEVMRYSPWTGMKAEMKQVDRTAPLMGAAQGALGGAMMGQQFGGGAAPAAAAPKSYSAMGSPEEAMMGAAADGQASAWLDPKLQKRPSFMGGGTANS